MPLNIDFRQIFLHMLNFVILFGGLYFLLYKPVSDFMEKRRKHYEEMASEAETNLSDARNSKAEYDARLAGAEEEVRAIKEQAKADAAAEARRTREQAEREADAILDKARADAEAEKGRMLNAAREEIEDIVSDVARKVLTQGRDPIDQFLASVEREERDEPRS
ncbi:MAG: ATP synthase F0 subunit B [Clostridia bacterium]|nr:ATP synthase F0 subunit B [Clostridia bacterium]